MGERITANTELIGLFAHPISHSHFPAMHNEAFAAMGLDYVYLAFEVDGRGIEDAVKAVRTLNMRGAHVSAPNQTTVGKYLDSLSPAARLCGTVNTIVNENGHLIGHNTDGMGLILALRNQGMDVAGRKITVAGAGGAAAAIEIQAALDGAWEITIFNGRDQFWCRAKDIVKKINEYTPCRAMLYPLEDLAGVKREIGESSLFVNGTGVGINPDYSYFRPGLVVADVVCEHGETDMLRVARESGCRTVNGLDMMLFQGAAAFELWTGKSMPIDHVRNVMGM